MTNDQNKKTLILYHADCPDGFGASFAAWKHFGDEAIYMGVFHNTQPPPEVEGRNVFTLDYSYNGENIEKIKKNALSLTIIDHHITNQSFFHLADKYVFDDDHSGAVLAWKYFHPKKKPPKLFEHIEDVDLWRFKLPNTKELSAIVNLYDFDYKVWDKIIREVGTARGLKKYVAEGKIVNKKLDKMVLDQSDDAEVVLFEGRKILAVNSSVNVSWLGNTLVERKPPLALVWSRRRNKIIVNLRSDGKFDVSKIAQKYGGGGHKSAAGFSFEVDNFFSDNIQKILDEKRPR